MEIDIKTTKITSIIPVINMGAVIGVQINAFIPMEEFSKTDKFKSWMRNLNEWNSRYNEETKRYNTTEEIK